MEHYVTLFDSLFAPQGLALHGSMERHLTSYTLWVLCVDNPTYEGLSRLELPNVKLLQLSTLETKDLLRVKSSRTKGEYCWTLTPYAPRFVFEADMSVARVTYLDADVWFRKSPDRLLAELTESGKEVLITDHAYAPEHDQSATSGQFCVQFLTFTRFGGEQVRSRWEQQCIDWCFARHEDGKFGDQKYLDDWPERYRDKVHVLRNIEAILAPWNATRFPYGNGVLYHFHGLRILSEHHLDLGGYYLPKPLLQNVYAPYLTDLKKAFRQTQILGINPSSQLRPRIATRLRHLLTQFHRGLEPLARARIIRW